MMLTGVQTAAVSGQQSLGDKENGEPASKDRGQMPHLHLLFFGCAGTHLHEDLAAALHLLGTDLRHSAIGCAHPCSADADPS